MRTLLSERFAPITSSIGFLELPLDEAARGLEEWLRSSYSDVAVSQPGDGFPEVLHRLEPLIGGARPRELLVSAGQWTAYFDCLLRGTDAESAIGYLSEKLHCRGLAIAAIPHTIGVPGIRQGRAGSVEFQMFGPEKTHFLNYIRGVAVMFDGRQWAFNATGAEQEFEEPDAYRARRVRDRFTSEMLERYCQSLGLAPFAAGGYGPDALLFESAVPRTGSGAVMSLAEAQAWLEIRPGMADQLPG